ncbi:hypothetical protein LGQ02_15710 [Bacillus shivajii]|uniref:hypothetical protein n=1 Tax=Bacillus shivajii TaxID=1983719 RepID=UPI001CFC12D6|nr:hypothetical protein [Bacillus shivajii]UCZ52277.1 hypothetical protein LGQ02_15710 [Bacillus shivajii]
MSVTFVYDKRLGISIPHMACEWETINKAEQEAILAEWEKSRGDIPDRVKELEDEINHLQQRLYDENDFVMSCKLNDEISELASTINDLWIWYRTGATISQQKKHA